MMIVRLLAACALWTLSLGCGGKAGSDAASRSDLTDQGQNASADRSAQPAAPSAFSPSGQSNAAVARSAAPDGAAAQLGELTQALRRYSVEHQRVPASLGEVAAAGYLKNAPQAPPGKKFAINPKRVEVILVNQ